MSYLGMNQNKGRSITDNDHIKQSIQDIILTPVGSRIQRREYGSMLFYLLDEPNDSTTQLKIMSAVVMALTQFEPRIHIDNIKFTTNAEKLTLSLTYYLKEDKTKQITSVEI